MDKLFELLNQEIKEAEEQCTQNNYDTGDIYDNGFNDGFRDALIYIKREIEQKIKIGEIKVTPLDLNELTELPF